MNTTIEKNLCNKVREVNEPYEIWKSVDGQWTWRVLRKYQKPSLEAKNKNARWYCAVKSPYTRGRWEYGDTYVREIKEVAIKQ